MKRKLLRKRSPRNGAKVTYNISLFNASAKLYCPGFIPIKENMDYQIRKPGKNIRKLYNILKYFHPDKVEVPKVIEISDNTESFRIHIPDNLYFVSTRNYYIVLYNGNNKISESILLNGMKIIFRYLYEHSNKNGIILYYSRGGKIHHALFNDAPTFLFILSSLKGGFTQPFGNFDVCSYCRMRNMCLKTIGIEEREIIDEGYRKIQRFVHKIKDSSKWSKTIKKIFQNF